MEVKLYSVDNSKEAKPLHVLLTFTMKTGDKYLIFESEEGELIAEEKKHFYKWRTISDVRVNPHKNMEKFNCCEICCYEKR